MKVYIKQVSDDPQACIIWMHGLGANAQDMMGLQEAFPTLLPIRHVFLNAPTRPVTLNQGMLMSAWFDIFELKLDAKEDSEGLLESESAIMAQVSAQIAEGFKPKQIFLAGFSQGGAMALYAGLRSKVELGGIVALSACLPSKSIHKGPPLHPSIPIFMGAGEFDAVISLQLVQFSIHYLQAFGYHNITHPVYPIGHSVCQEEIEALCHWLGQKCMVGKTHDQC